LYKEHQEINNVLSSCFSAASMPEVSIGIEAMLSKTDINIYVEAATRRTENPRETIHFP
jgi:hypothetical protein